jgi:hypothetical protein
VNLSFKVCCFTENIDVEKVNADALFFPVKTLTNLPMDFILDVRRGYDLVQPRLAALPRGRDFFTENCWYPKNRSFLLPAFGRSRPGRK